MKKYAGIIALGAIAIIIILVLVTGKGNMTTNEVVGDPVVSSEVTSGTDMNQGNTVVNVPVSTGTTTPVTVTTNPPKTPTPSPAPTPKPGTFTLAQVATRNTESNCYSAINGVVYDLTAWINKHPGGSREILRICGKDGSSAFNGQHGGDAKPEQILAGFEVGVLH